MSGTPLRQKNDMRMIRGALLATLFVAAFFCTVQRCVAAPALWLVQTPTSKVYLFGTVHVLNDTLQWQSPELEAAIAESSDLYLEVGDLNQAEAAKSMLKLGLDREHPLSKLLPKSYIALLDAQARKYGMPGEAVFEPMRPWLAYVMISMLPALHSGSGASSSGGADMRIRKQFVDAGKPIHGFETFDGQAHVLADLPQTVQIALLESALKTSSTQSSTFPSMVEAWRSGDTDSLAHILQLDQMEKSPIYKPLIGDRNAAFAAAIAERLKQPGTSFVAVGAAHMVGSNGVPALLEKMGFTVTRVKIADASPAPSSSALPSAGPAATPTPAPSATASPTPPPPAILTPPSGWKALSSRSTNGVFKVDRTWSDPAGRGFIMTAHLAGSSAAFPDLDTFDVFFHQGLVSAAGASNVQPSKHVTVCDGKQNALYTSVKLNSVKEDIVLTMTDHVYISQYVRNAGAKDDPAALHSLFSLCAP